MANNGRGKSPGSRKALEEHGFKLNSEKAAEAGRKSGEARRQRKTFREELLLMLSDGTVQKDIAAALIREAIAGNNAGSVRGAFETIRDTIGEKPKDAIELSGAGQVKFVFGSPDEDDEYSG